MRAGEDEEAGGGILVEIAVAFLFVATSVQVATNAVSCGHRACCWEAACPVVHRVRGGVWVYPPLLIEMMLIEMNIFNVIDVPNGHAGGGEG